MFVRVCAGARCAVVAVTLIGGEVVGRAGGASGASEGGWCERSEPARVLKISARVRVLSRAAEGWVLGGGGGGGGGGVHASARNTSRPSEGVGGGRAPVRAGT